MINELMFHFDPNIAENKTVILHLFCFDRQRVYASLNVRARVVRVSVCVCVCEREGGVRETIEYIDDMTPVKLKVFTTMMWQKLIYSQNHQNLENSSGKKYSGVSEV